MKRTFAPLCVVLLLTCIGSVAAQSTTDPVAKEIVRLYEEERVAMLKGDLQTLSRIFADDFVVTNPFNEFLTKKQVLDRVKQRTIAFSRFEREVEYVKEYGDTAVTAGHETFVPAEKMRGAGQPIRLRITGVWLRKGGQWKQVARHASVIRSPDQ